MDPQLGEFIGEMREFKRVITDDVKEIKQDVKDLKETRAQERESRAESRGVTKTWIALFVFASTALLEVVKTVIK
jgi:hypothetical protein